MKEYEKYLPVFQHAAQWIDKSLCKKTGIEVATGIILDSVYLKMYKPSWATPGTDPMTARSRIFFSVWMGDKSLSEKMLFYNIHAFKLRELEGYKIESRKLAALFRKKFAPFAHQWENVRVDFGPLTLMEGWSAIDPSHFQHVIAELANRFFTIEPLIEETLAAFAK